MQETAGGMTMQQQKQQEEKSLRTKIIIVTACLVALIIFVLVFNSNLFYSHTTAVTIDDTTYTVADFNYYYVTVYNNYYSTMYSTYGSYVSFVLPSSGTSFRSQTYDSTTGETWADYFEDMAFTYMERVTMLCNEAKAAGFELTDDDYAEIEENIASMKTETASASSSSGYTDFASYLRYIYGKGMTEKIFRRNLEKVTLASNYSTYVTESYEYSDSEIKDYYDEHKDEYDYITYHTYFIDASTYMDSEDDEESTVTFDEALAMAEEEADKFISAATDEQAYVAYAKQLDAADAEDDTDSDTDTDSTVATTLGSSISSTYSDWLLDSSRKAGDVCSISIGSEDDDSTMGYYVLYFVDRDSNDYNAVSGYYMLGTPDTVTESDYDSTEAYEAAVEDAKESMEAVMELIENGYNLSDPGYDSFVETYNMYYSNIDGGGDITTVGKNDVPDSIVDWLFDDSREEGDTTLIYDEDYGFFYLYFSSKDGLYCDTIADAQMRSDDYSDWEDTQLENYTADSHWVMHFSKRMVALGG
jgi:hypothetical protein